MFQKIALSLICLFTCSFCFGQTGLPDPNSWFIQPLLSDQINFLNYVQVSDTYTVWWQEGPNGMGTFYYDGAGIYELQHEGSTCFYPSLSGNSIVARTSGGILFYQLGYRYLFAVSDTYYNYPDVYENQVVWEAGSDLNNTNIYYEGGTGVVCLTDNAQCFYNGKRPRVSADTIAWISNDGTDDEIFISKDGVITQLTNNDIEDGSFPEYGIQMADDGTMAWMAENDPPSAHYYDGEHVHQLSVGGFIEEIWGISEMGVLYSVGNHPDYSEFENVLLLHNGTEDVFLFGTEPFLTEGIIAAAVGGNSISWIGREAFSDDYRVYFLKDQELISWSLESNFLALLRATGVWGNRLVWTTEQGLYFGQYLDSPACVNPPVMDGNNDCQVNLADYAMLASEWLFCGYADQSACQ